MNYRQKKIRAAVRRDNAEEYLLVTLIAFAVSVVFTRVFLHLTGFPQLGNDVLHIAHALWGGLLLIVAVFLPLIFVNRWIFNTSAILSGVGIGLFIDEIGKFITQTNDYFFPPAVPLIYGFFLLIAFVFLQVRKPLRADPRKAMYHVFEGLQDALDGDMDIEEAARIETQLEIARRADRSELVSLANAIGSYLDKEKHHLSKAEPDFWKRAAMIGKELGQRVGRRKHRNIISGIMILWGAFVVGYIAVLVKGIPSLDPQVVQWSEVLIGIQGVIGVLMIIAIIAWLAKKEEFSLRFGVSGFLLSLVALQTLYFYISQSSAITAALLQVIFLRIILFYRRWYL